MCFWVRRLMARYVVLSFEDNEEADMFVASTIAFLPASNASDDPEIARTVEVVGLYAQPTQFCDLPHTKAEWKEYESKHAKQAWTRGAKYGWIICVICHKPSGKHLPPDGLARVIISRAVNLLWTTSPSQS